ncbi:MAG: hypothetical protein A3F09_03520 [Chlamydiae bacterium RIFCSPHIGHO2_12_FULL_49_11]|nr:MAG: hypothetical protein A3F09_03520 [Chlamydiae bacterium RIFCSPHIGHO2_12_FULL_49_11]
MSTSLTSLLWVEACVKGGTLDFSAAGLKLSCTNIRDIASYLVAVRTVHVINLSNTPLDISAVQTLSEKVRSFPHLFHQLVLQNIRLTDEGGGVLASMLEQNYTLVRLDLSFNKINHSAMRFLAAVSSNSTLTHFNLSHNEIAASDRSSWERLLRSNTTLVRLDLSSNVLDYFACEEISRMRNESNSRVEIDLDRNWSYDNKAPDCSLALMVTGLLEHRFFVRIDFSGVASGAACWKLLGHKLKECAFVETVLFNKCLLRCDAVAVLADVLVHNRKITRIELRQNRFGDAGAQILCEAVRINTVLETLDLSCNYESWWGEENIRLWNAPVVWEKARSKEFPLSVVLANNGLGPDRDEYRKALEILGHVDSLSILDLHDQPVISRPFLDLLSPALKGNISIHTINMNGCMFEKSAMEKLVEILNENRSIVSLHLIGCNLLSEERGLLESIRRTSLKILR